jgi:hypothetical protein
MSQSRRTHGNYPHWLVGLAILLALFVGTSQSSRLMAESLENSSAVASASLGGGTASETTNDDPEFADMNFGVYNGKIVITGFVWDDGPVGEIEMTVDGVYYGVGAVNSDHSITFLIPAPNYSKLITIIAEDAYGGTASYSWQYTP